jgi:hypothetical protein
MKPSILILSVFTMLACASCYNDKGDKLYPNVVQCDTSGMKYSTNIQPIIQTNCLNQGCHTSGNPSGGFKFDSYDNLVLVIPGDKLLNALQYTAGGSKNMPPTGKMNDCDISKISAWIKRGYPNN